MQHINEEQKEILDWLEMSPPSNEKRLQEFNDAQASIKDAKDKADIISALHKVRNYLVSDPEYQKIVLQERVGQACRAAKGKRLSQDEAKEIISDFVSTHEGKLAKKKLGLSSAHFRGSGAFRGSEESQNFRKDLKIRQVEAVTTKLHSLSPDRERIIAMLENYIITKEPRTWDDKILTEKRKALAEEYLKNLYDPKENDDLKKILKQLEIDNNTLSANNQKLVNSGVLHKLLTSEIEKLEPPPKKQSFLDKIKNKL